MKITANGISMNYTLDGPASAPVVTLSHSLATTLEMWQPQLKALTARWRVLSYDTRGHGGTDAPKAAYTLDQLADDAQALLRALGIQRTHWVGLWTRLAKSSGALSASVWPIMPPIERPTQCVRGIPSARKSACASSAS